MAPRPVAGRKHIAVSLDPDILADLVKMSAEEDRPVSVMAGRLIKLAIRAGLA